MRAQLFQPAAKVEHLAELAELKNEAAEIALRKLANRSLVIPDQEETAFSLVPMVADFLRRARPEAVIKIGNQLEQRAFALIMEIGNKNPDRFPALDSAWPMVSSALPLFVAGPNRRLQAVCTALSNFLNFTGRWDEWLSLCQQAEVKAVAAGDYKSAGWRAYQAGAVHSLRQRADDLLSYADRASAHWKTAKAGARERASALAHRGFGHTLKKKYPAAIAAYREALALLRSLATKSDDVAIVLNDLARVEAQIGDFVAAERDYGKALRVAHEVGYIEGEAYITGNLAQLALDRENWAETETLARKALPLSEKVGRKELIAADCRRIAKAMIQQGKPGEAAPYAHRALEIFIQLNLPSEIEAAHAVLAECEA